MKIIIHSNAPWCATGYGQQTAQLAKRLLANGHEVAVSALYGLSGAKLDWNGIMVYPNYVDPHGNDVLLGHAEDWFGGGVKDGLIITLYDAWVLAADQLREANVASWVPIDHDPAPPKVIRQLKASGAMPVAMSRHGQRMLQDAGLDPEYAPHGIDTQALAPTDPKLWRGMIKPEIPEDWFVAGIVAANKGNPSRKSFDVSFQAFAKHLKEHPDSLLYVHSEVSGAMQGVNLIDLAQACEIPSENIRFSPQYHQSILGFAPEHMSAVFSSFDVLLNPAQGEGFGIPVIEAQSCGVPVIVTDWTAMSELCGAGQRVEGQRQFTMGGSWTKSASVDEVTRALDQAYNRRGRDAKKAREFALQYDADKVFDEHWRPILDKWQKHFDDRVVVEPSVEVVA